MLEQQRCRVKPQEPVRATSAVWSVQELWDLVFTVDNYIIFLFTVRLIVLYFYSFAFSLYIWMNKKHAGPDSSSLKLKQTKFSFGFTTVLLLTWPELPWKKKKKKVRDNSSAANYTTGNRITKEKLRAVADDGTILSKGGFHRSVSVPTCFGFNNRWWKMNESQLWSSLHKVWKAGVILADGTRRMVELGIPQELVVYQIFRAFYQMYICLILLF